MNNEWKRWVVGGLGVVLAGTVAVGTVTTLVINVTGTNDAPVVGTATVSVSEEGLAAGIADSNGSTDVGGATPPTSRCGRTEPRAPARAASNGRTGAGGR